MGPGICVSDKELKAFALGQLDDAESEVIAAHISDCPKCEETLCGFDDTNDSVLDAIRKVSTSEAEPEDAAPDADLLRRIENPWTDVEDGKPHKPMGERIRDYQLIERLGAGGMGTVYKAVHCRLDRIVALKTLPNRRLRDAAAVSRFHREMKAIGRLDHPAIVRASDAGDDDGTHFIAMDFVDGIDLSQLVKLHGAIDVASACEIIRQAALGLQYAHEQGLIHRDVKPSNLMLTMTQPNVASVKLLDLGLALFGAASEAVDELTTVGQLMGTLDYMAPEQADNSHDVDARADVYSLGATLFKLLTSTAPYETSERLSPLRKMKALATVDAPSVATRRIDLPSEVIAITDRMLLRDPAARFATAKDVAEAVAPLCEGHRLAELTREGMRLRSERENAPGTEKAEERMGQAVSEDGWPGLEGDSPKPRGFLRSAQSSPGHPDALESRRHSPSDAARKMRAPAFVTRRVTATLIAATLGLLAVLAFGFVIRLKTDTGTLVIECDSADVPIEIRQGKETVETLTVSNGANELTLRSGTYEIVLPKDINSLTVDAGKVELRRGERSIVKITEIATSKLERAVASTIGEAPVNENEASSAAIDLPLGDVSKIIHDPVQQVEFAHRNLIRRYSELRKKVDRLKDALEQVERTLGNNHPSVLVIKEDLRYALDSSERTEAEIYAMSVKLEKTRQEYVVQSREQAASTEQVFEGKTFDQWKHLIETERSTSELVKAVDALGVLGKGTHDREVVETILKVIEQRPYADPKDRADIDAQLTIAAVRSVRALDPKKVAAEIIPGFAARAPSIHEFILAGILGLTEQISQVAKDSTRSQMTPLGPYEPLANLLDGDDLFWAELFALYEAKEGRWNWPGYTLLGAVDSSWSGDSRTFGHLTDRGSTILFFRIAKHVSQAGMSDRIRAFLRGQLGDPAQDPIEKHALAASQAAALLLARYSPDDSLAQIFVRGLEDDLRRLVAKQPADISKGGDFFAGGPNLDVLSAWKQENEWLGLEMLGQHAEPAVPFLLRIFTRQGGDNDDADSVQRLVKRYDELSALCDNSDNQTTIYAFNMRLLAIEIIARSGTKNPEAIELLRNEFQSLFGQQPTVDGPFEIIAGRDKLLPIASDGLSFLVKHSIRAETEHPVSPVEIEMANSCLLAWKELTGEPPRFAIDSVGDLATREWPEGTTTANMPKVVKRDP